MAEEGLTALKKEVDSNKALATAADTIAESAAKGAKELAEKAQTLATETGEKLSNTEKKLNEFIQIGETLFTDIGAFVMQGIEQKESNQLTRLDITALLSNLKQEPKNIARTVRVFEGLANLPEAEVAEVLPQALEHVLTLVQDDAITKHVDRRIKKEASAIKAFIEVQKKLPQNEADPIKYAEKFNEAIDTQKGKLGNYETNLKNLVTETEESLPQKFAESFEKVVSDLRDLLSSPILPTTNEIRIFSNNPNNLAYLKGRIFDGAQAGEALSLDLAEAILNNNNLKTDPELLAHLAGTLADDKHPLASNTALVTSLKNAVADYVTNGTTSKPLAKKLQAVLGELANPPDNTKKFDKLASDLGLNKATDKAILDLLTKYHDSKPTTIEQLQYIQTQLKAIARAVEADKPKATTS